MGIIKKGILGGFKGKVGTVNGYVLKGQDIMRGQPEQRTVPFSKKELANQQKFGDVQAWLRPLTIFLRVGFQDYAPTFEGFVAAKSHIMKNAMFTDDAGAHIDPAKALVSFGDQEQATTAAAVSESTNTITYSWEGGTYDFDDRAMFLVYDIEGGVADFDTAAVRRTNEGGVFKLNENFSGKTVHVYLAFVAEDRKRRSNSQYLGTVTVL
uniref:DUF6266 family protein n=1 Tax=Pedobacter schmidteae TaxID=2201271 RepID=UPI000EB52072|nr:DUF6266 family protein [Pedobacter schmidteae]